MIYNENYYKGYDGVGYDKKEHWFPFFQMIADKIISDFNPHTVLDVGCAWGYLVEALRDRGVEAYGIDISKYAISNTREDLRQYFNAQPMQEKLPDNFPKKFDVVTNIEVIEHVPEEDCEIAIAALCSYSDVVIFSSSASDVTDPTHINVQQPEYWAKRFARNGFFTDPDFSALYISPDARCYRRQNAVSAAEKHEHFYRLQKKNFSELTQKFNELSEENENLKSRYEIFYRNTMPKIYPDFGNGFEESTAIVCDNFDNGLNLLNFKCHFDIPPKRVRFDPVGGIYCVVTYLSLTTDNGIISEPATHNGIFCDGRYFFSSYDSWFIFENDRNAIDFTVSAHIFALSNADFSRIVFEMLSKNVNAVQEISSRDEKLAKAENAFAELDETINQNDKLIKNLENKLKDKNSTIADYERKIEEYNTTILNLKKQLEREKKTIDRITIEKSNYEERTERIREELAHYKIHYNAAIDQRNEFKEDSENWRNAYLAMNSSFFWKITFPARKVLDGIKWLLRKNKFTYLLGKGLVSLKRNGVKKTWAKVKYRCSGKYRLKSIMNSNTLSAEERKVQQETVFDKDVVFSILVPLYNTPIRFLDEMIASVTAQTYGKWELCLADGSDKKHKNVAAEVKKLARNDKRIKYIHLEKNLGISENTNACIDMSTGNYIALFDHDDVLHPSALYEVMRKICDEDADFIYTDEATFESPNINKIITAHFKPDFAIDNLRANNYICHLSVFSREVLEKAGKFRKKYDGSQDHDMVLRLTANAEKIVHIPKILYYWRSHPLSVAADINSKTYAINAGKNAVKNSIEKTGYNCEVTSSRAFPTIYHIKYEIKSYDKVSIIIPNKNHLSDLQLCISSILEKTTYPDYEIVIVDNGSDDEELFEYYDELKKDPRFTICSLDIEFNYSRLNNFAAEKATGKYYILLNNDIEIITPEWIEEMLMYVQRDDVGAAGAMLYFPNDTVQHAGLILGLGGVCGHCFEKVPKDSVGYMGRLCYAQDMSAVTAACMMIKASVFKEVGGFDESFKVAYNDVDLCLKVRKAGYLIVWTPYAEAYHYESKSRGHEDTPEKLQRLANEAARFKNKWSKELEAGDPYYNPNFTLTKSDFSLKEE